MCLVLLSLHFPTPDQGCKYPMNKKTLYNAMNEKTQSNAMNTQRHKGKKNVCFVFKMGFIDFS